MVSGLKIVFMIITILISIGLPIGLTIYMYKKYKIRIKAVLIGALMFFVFQGLLRIPIMTYIQKQDFYRNFAVRNMVVTILIIAFTAGLFETVGRYIGMKFFLRDSLEWKNGVAYGIGHGGIEAILLVGFTYIANLIVSILINSGSISSLSYSQLLNTGSDLFLAAGVERLFTILLHIALSLIVLYGIMYRKKLYILLCILIHTFVDFIGPLLAVKKVSAWGIEGFIAVVGVLSLIFIIRSGKMFKSAAASSSEEI
jgi:uncharacterized membrane protein YhfC